VHYHKYNVTWMHINVSLKLIFFFNSSSLVIKFFSFLLFYAIMYGYGILIAKIFNEIRHQKMINEFIFHIFL
jgi:hypothetical protein